MTIRKHTVHVNSGAGQTGENFGPWLNNGGYIESIQYVKVDYTDGVDFTITAEATGENIWTELNVNAAVTKRPRAPTQNTSGVASLYADGGAAVNDKIALGRDRVKIAIAQAGASKTGTFIITTSDR